MPRLQRKSFDRPETVRKFGHGHIDTIALDETEIGRLTLQPGWRWSADVRPVVGTEWCQNRHVGVALEGAMHVELADGTSIEVKSGDAYEIPPGHDAWVLGEETFVTYEWVSSRVFALPPDADDGVIVTMLFTDIVGSTATIERIGDRAWRDLLLAHNVAMRDRIASHRGREFDWSGDGFMAMFDGAARAAKCGLAMIRAAQDLGLHIRAGCHTGEVIMVAGYPHGVAVHTAARVMSLAAADEEFVSAATKELLGGGAFSLEPAGSFELKGLTGAREVFRLRA